MGDQSALTIGELAASELESHALVTPFQRSDHVLAQGTRPGEVPEPAKGQREGPSDAIRVAPT